MKEDKALVREITEETIDWKNRTMESFVSSQSCVKKWSRNGLNQLFVESKGYFEDVTRVELPYNLEMQAPYYGRSRWRDGIDFDEVAVPVFRFCGWLKAAAEFSTVVKLISRSVSQNGVNSPYTHISLFDLAAQHPSPGRLSRFLAKVKDRAAQILAPYGLSPSWVAMAQVLVRSSQVAVGKTAIKVAGETVRRFLSEGKPGKVVGKMSGTARQVLIKSRGLNNAIRGSRVQLLWAFDAVEDGRFSCLREALVNCQLSIDFTDGVNLWIDSATEKTIHGIKTVRGYSESGFSQWLITHDGESYHYEISRYWTDCKGRRRAILFAIGAWKRRKEEDVYDRRIIEKILPKDRTVLVFITDSLEAGNCRPGTMAFMESNGWGGRQFVPASWLVRHKTRGDVRRVLVNVASKF